MKFPNHIPLDTYKNDVHRELYNQIWDELDKISVEELHDAINSCSGPRSHESIAPSQRKKTKISEALAHYSNRNSLGKFLNAVFAINSNALGELLVSQLKALCSLTDIDTGENKENTLDKKSLLNLVEPTNIEPKQKSNEEKTRVLTNNSKSKKRYFYVIAFALLAFCFVSIPNFTKDDPPARSYSYPWTSKNSPKINYCALIMANQNYDHPNIWSNLKTPIKDAQRLKKILQEKYAVEKIELLEDVPLQKMEDSFVELTSSIGKDDSVLIYYAGHGAKKDGKSFWVPKDGNEQTTEYMSNVEIKDHLLNIASKCKHVLLISDSCFSGLLFRAGKIEEIKKDDNFFEIFYNNKSCQVITSADAEAQDTYRKSSNSPFAALLCDLLENSNTKEICATDLGVALYKQVPSIANQRPNFGKIKEAINNGEFFFVKPNDNDENATKESYNFKELKIDASSFSLTINNFEIEKIDGIERLVIRSQANKWVVKNCIGFLEEESREGNFRPSSTSFKIIIEANLDIYDYTITAEGQNNSTKETNNAIKKIKGEIHQNGATNVLILIER